MEYILEEVFKHFHINFFILAFLNELTLVFRLSYRCVLLQTNSASPCVGYCPVVAFGTNYAGVQCYPNISFYSFSVNFFAPIFHPCRTHMCLHWSRDENKIIFVAMSTFPPPAEIHLQQHMNISVN